MTTLIDEIIHKCRYSRITNNSDDFNKMANMITSRKDLNFGDYYDMKRFSCTEETERKFYRRFKEEYDELFKCLAENSYSKNLGPSRYLQSNLDNSKCYGIFNHKTGIIAERSMKYLKDKEIKDIVTLLID